MSLAKVFPEGKCSHDYRGLSWSGDVQPLDYMRTYRLRLDYKMGKPPRVFVVKPNLRELSDGKRIPHLYDQDSQHLCLYRPNMGLWSAEKFLSKTILPWAQGWLMFFELWLATGTWHGRAYGHPGDDPIKQPGI